MRCEGVLEYSYEHATCVLPRPFRWLLESPMRPRVVLVGFLWLVIASAVAPVVAAAGTGSGISNAYGCYLPLRPGFASAGFISCVRRLPVSNSSFDRS